MGTRPCRRCGTVVTGAWWCGPCKAARGKSPKDHSRYGGQHQAKRAKERDSAYGQPCARCGGQLTAGQPIELDHDEHGGYRGWSHRGCNRRAGGRKGALIVNGRRNGKVTTAVPDRPAPRPCDDCGRTECRHALGYTSRCW